MIDFKKCSYFQLNDQYLPRNILKYNIYIEQLGQVKFWMNGTLHKQY